MDLTHSFTVPASVEETWAAFNDLERIAPCFPGATLTSVDGDDFAGSVKVKLGPISLLYNGTGSFKERDEAGHRAVIEAKGKDKRGNGTAAATVTAVLSPDGDGTAVEVVTDLAVTGRPAQFGRGVMQDVSDKLLGQFVGCMAGKLQTVSPAPLQEAATQPDTEPAAEPVPGPVADESATTSSSVTSDAPPAAELNALTTIGPVLLRRYARPLLGLVGALVILRKLLRRRS
ncbi:MAG: SRPBCC family protein [Nocardioidaceae bacterium]